MISKIDNRTVQVDLQDILSKKLSQLQALLNSISGAGFSSFVEQTPIDQENLLWLAADLSTAAANALKKVEGNE